MTIVPVQATTVPVRDADTLVQAPGMVPARGATANVAGLSDPTARHQVKVPVGVKTDRAMSGDLIVKIAPVHARAIGVMMIGVHLSPIGMTSTVAKRIRPKSPFDLSR
jgi:hypothetical protein